MNKRGISVIVTLMIAVTIIILGLALAPALNEINLGIRGENNTLLNNNNGDLGRSPGLNCLSNSSDFDEGACIVSDLYNPLFIAVLLGLAGVIIGAKVVLSK